MSDLDRLFAAWLAGPLTEGEARALQELLTRPDQRRRWRALADLEGALAERGAAVAQEPELASPHTTRRIRIRRRPVARRRWWPLALAAGLLLAVCAGWLLRPLPDGDLPSCAGRVLARGAAVAGPAILRWPDGSEATLAATGQARVPGSGKGVDLEAGVLEVHATPQLAEHRFAVQTPQARAEVHGTRFNLRCADGITSLLVAEGTVWFTPTDGAAQVVVAGGQAQAGRPAAPRAGLVAWWPLDEGAGSTARDASGNGHDGRIVGAGWTSEGLRFAGGDDRIDIDPLGALATLHAGDYSLSAWYRPEALPERGDPAGPPESRRDDLAVIVGRTGWTLGLHQALDGSFFMQHFLADGQPKTRHAPGHSQLGRWYHLVGVVDRTRGETLLAVDGSLGGPAKWPTPGAVAYAYQPDQSWHIGISTPHGTTCRWPARGLIRGVRVYDRALTAEEIHRLAAAP